MKKTTFFVSHASEDGDFAKALADAMKDQGARVWLDAELHPGESWAAAFEKELRKSDWIVFLLRSEASLSPFTLFEMGAAVGLGKHILPVVPRDLDLSKIPYPLRIRKSLVRGPAEKTARQILAAAHENSGDKESKMSVRKSAEG